MIIKMIDNKEHKRDRGIERPVQETYVVEAYAYQAEMWEFQNEEEYEEVFKRLQGSFGNYYVPFGFHMLKPSVGGQLFVLQVTEPQSLVIVASGCSVFIMSDQGKTVDRFNVISKFSDQGQG